MGGVQVGEIFASAPPELDAAEILVLVAIAEHATAFNQEVYQRDVPGPGRWMLHERCHLTERGLRSVLTRLAKRGIEVRKVVAKDSDGRPIYGHRNQRVVYVLPDFKPSEGGTKRPPSEAKEGGTKRPPSRGKKVARNDHLPRQEGGALVPPSCHHVPPSGPSAQSYGSLTETNKNTATTTALLSSARSPKPRKSVAEIAVELAPVIDPLCRLLADRVEESTERRPSITENWRKTCRLMLTRDGLTAEQIRNAILWATNDEFWRVNILSMPTLRKQYPRLRASALREQRQTRQREAARAARPSKKDEAIIDFIERGKAKQAARDARTRELGS